MLLGGLSNEGLQPRGRAMENRELIVPIGWIANTGQTIQLSLLLRTSRPPDLPWGASPFHTRPLGHACGI